VRFRAVDLEVVGRTEADVNMELLRDGHGRGKPVTKDGRDIMLASRLVGLRAHALLRRAGRKSVDAGTPSMDACRGAQNLRLALVDGHGEFTKRVDIVSDTAKHGLQFLPRIGDFARSRRLAGC
jgi:hypothetical protein